MKLSYSVATTGVMLAISLAAAAATPPVTRYSVIELAEPQTPAECLPGYATRALSTGLNDQGVASANFRCYREIGTDPIPFVNTANIGYATTAHSGVVPLTMPPGEETASYSVSLDSQRVYGHAFGTQTRGIIWSLSGGFEEAFQPFDCFSGGRLDMANSGNESGYVVGWAFRTDPSLPPPLDSFCLALGWVVRTPSGQFYGPINGTPIDVNRSSVAVGTSGTAGLMVHLPSRREIVLNAGEPTRAVTPTDINDRGEVLGFIEDVSPDGLNRNCGRSDPVFWQRSGAQLSLPKLPGHVSGRPWSTYSNGIVVGETGPGDYCNPTSLPQQRAVIWHGTRVTDLNSLVAATEDLTLTYAAEINASGQILATGFRNGDALLPCPDMVPGPGGMAVDFTLTCRNLRSFLLTPRP
jgi:hypothetical protein